jgi:hypothetical protein
MRWRVRSGKPGSRRSADVGRILLPRCEGGLNGEDELLPQPGGFEGGQPHFQ